MSNRILSYRGLLADGGQDTILLSTKKGEKGYRIIKLELFPNEPGQQGMSNTVKIYKVFQSAINNTVDFSDNRLLAAAYYQEDANPAYPSALDVVFDQEIFNQDIYVTNRDTDGDRNVNYYIELEQVPLTEDQALVTIVKNLRNEQ